MRQIANNPARIKSLKGKIREFVCSLLFPLRCPVCDDILSPEEKEKGIHFTCESKFYPVQGAVCMHCGRSLLSIRENHPEKMLKNQCYGESTKEFCEDCKRRGYAAGGISGSRSPAEQQWSENTHSYSAIHQGRALYHYRGAIKSTMYRFKYSNKREYAMFFAKQAVRQYPQLFKRVDAKPYQGDAWERKKDKRTRSENPQTRIQAIIPVPMYLPKQKKRGYNQAECFARELSKITGIPVDTRVIQRVQDTTPQKELNDVERKNNLKNAFQKRKNIVQYSHVLVVDDIYTTGSTVEAVAKELKNLGIRQIDVLSICIGGGM